MDRLEWQIEKCFKLTEENQALKEKLAKAVEILRNAKSDCCSYCEGFIDIMEYEKQLEKTGE